MFQVIMYYITPKGFHHKVVPLSQFYFSEIPDHVVVITVLNDNDEAKIIFAMKNRVIMKEDYEKKKINFYTKDHKMSIPSYEKGKIFITPFFMMRVITKIMIETRTNVYRKLEKRIEGFAKKKQLLIHEIGSTNNST